MTTPLSSTPTGHEIAVSTDIRCPMKLMSPQFIQDPHAVLAAMREAGPAAVVVHNGFRMWVMTRYDDVRRLLADSSFKKDLIEHRRGVVAQCAVEDKWARLPHASRRSALERDGADHRRLRAVLGGMFSPARLAPW